jgi:hypothetical protein
MTKVLLKSVGVVVIGVVAADAAIMRNASTR